MTDKCPNCGEILTKNERLRKYYCSSCGYQIKFESIKTDDISKEKSEKIEELKIEESNDFIINCPECGGEYTFENGEIYCKTCGKNHELKSSEVKSKIFQKVRTTDEVKIGFFCPKCGEKYSVINGEIYCKNCDKLNEGELKKDKKIELVCPKCHGEYYFDEESGKVGCKDCGYQPEIENKEYVVDTDSSMVLTIECDKCGSNMGYDMVGNKIVCKSCGSEIDRKYFEKKKHKKVISKDGIVAKRLTKKIIRCKNCGGNVEGFDFYKTEFCPNCGTINVVVEDIASLRLEPNKIVPYDLKVEDAIKTLENYAKNKGIKIKVTGSWKQVYMPFWQFHFEKVKLWYKKKHSYVDKNHKLHSYILEEGREEVQLNDVWVSAKEEFNSDISFDIMDIDMEKAIEYSPEILDILTERYNIGTTEAEVIANDMIYDYLYELIWSKKDGLKALLFNTLELDYGTYKSEFQQVLIPTWQNLCEINNEQYFFTINGQNGDIKIAGYGIKRNLQREKFEDIKEKTENIVIGVLDVLSWLKK